MNDTDQTVATLIAILGLIVGILALLRDFFNFQWQNSGSAIKRLLVDRRFWGLIALGLVVLAFWLLYHQNSTLAASVTQKEVILDSIYKTQTAAPIYQSTIEALISAPTSTPIIVEATRIVKETAIVQATVRVEVTRVVTAIPVSPVEPRSTDTSLNPPVQPSQQITSTPTPIIYSEGDIAELNGAELSLLRTDFWAGEAGFTWRVANRAGQDQSFQFAGSDLRYTGNNQTLAVTQILCPGGINCNEVSIRLKPGETFEYFNRVRVDTACSVREIKITVRNISHLNISNWIVPVPGC